jgi:hypothetical protein
MLSMKSGDKLDRLSLKLEVGTFNFGCIRAGFNWEHRKGVLRRNMISQGKMRHKQLELAFVAVAHQSFYN